MPNVRITVYDSGNTDRHDPPETIGSGAPRKQIQRADLPQFPNNTELIVDESDTNTQILSALLPALQKYNCLHFSPQKPRRSPWVRAFCDLYHPAGPWGCNRFNHNIDITSQRKYSFKSYQVPTLHKKLLNYGGQCATRLALQRALAEYFHKEIWYKQYLEGCQRVAVVEVNKPEAERAPIPTVQAAVAAVAPSLPPPAAEATVPDPVGVRGATPPPTAAAHHPQGGVVDAAPETTALDTPSPRKRAREAQEPPSPGPVTRAQKRQAKESAAAAVPKDTVPTKQDPVVDGYPDDEEDTEAVAAASKVTAPIKQDPIVDDHPEDTDDHVDVTQDDSDLETEPPQQQHYGAEDSTNAKEGTADSQKEELEKKRNQLVALVSKPHTSDSLSEKIQAKIDKIDEELLDIIMS